MRRSKFRYPVTSLAGSTPGNIIKTLKAHGAQKGYYLKVSLSFLVAVILTPFNGLEKMIWRGKIRDFKFEEPPVFIIGFMRSGTTLLHNLLCLDPKAGYTTTFQTVFPHTVLTQKWWLQPLTNHFLPAKRPFDNVSMDMNLPQEEEFAMANIQPHSIYNFFLFPSEFDWFLENEYLPGSMSDRDFTRWKTEYRQLIVKSLFNTNGVRYVSKNPHNIPRMAILREIFPGCRFIFIYRDPYTVVESLYHFILSIFPGVQLQDVPSGFSRKNVARFYSIAMRKYLESHGKPGLSPILEIKMEDFMEDPAGGLRKIYTFFGFDAFEKMLPLFEEYLGKNPCTHQLGSDIHQETIRYVNEYAREIVLELGYSLRNNT